MLNHPLQVLIEKTKEMLKVEENLRYGFLRRGKIWWIIFQVVFLWIILLLREGQEETYIDGIII